MPIQEISNPPTKPLSPLGGAGASHTVTFYNDIVSVDRETPMESEIPLEELRNLSMIGSAPYASPQAYVHRELLEAASASFRGKLGAESEKIRFPLDVTQLDVFVAWLYGFPLKRSLSWETCFDLAIFARSNGVEQLLDQACVLIKENFFTECNGVANVEVIEQILKDRPDVHEACDIQEYLARFVTKDFTQRDAPGDPYSAQYNDTYSSKHTTSVSITSSLDAQESISIPGGRRLRQFQPTKMDFGGVIRFQLSDNAPPGFLHSYLLEDVVHPRPSKESPCIPCSIEHLAHYAVADSDPPSLLHASSFTIFASWLYFHTDLTLPSHPLQQSGSLNPLLDLYADSALLPSYTLYNTRRRSNLHRPLPVFRATASRFRTALVAAILAHCQSRPTVPTAAEIARAFAETLPGDPLRAVLADAYITKGVLDARGLDHADFQRELNSALVSHESKLGVFLARVQNIVAEAKAEWDLEGRPRPGTALEWGMAKVIGLLRVDGPAKGGGWEDGGGV